MASGAVCAVRILPRAVLDVGADQGHRVSVDALPLCRAPAGWDHPSATEMGPVPGGVSVGDGMIARQPGGRDGSFSLGIMLARWTLNESLLQRLVGEHVQA